MGKDEAKALKREGALEDTNGQMIPTFGFTNKVYQILTQMSGDATRRFFRGIGVRNPDEVVIFETDAMPAVGPIPQRNGLYEYKFNPGTPVLIRDRLRI